MELVLALNMDGYGSDPDKDVAGFGVTPKLSYLLLLLPLLTINLYGYEFPYGRDIVLGKMLSLKWVIHLQDINLQMIDPYSFLMNMD